MKAPLVKALIFAVCSLAGASLLFIHPAAQGTLPEGGSPGALFWVATLFVAALAVQSVRLMAALDGSRWVGMATAALFGVWIVYFWQLLVVAFEVPRVLLPPPGMILQSLAQHSAILWGDFVQTVLKAVLMGWAVGSGLGFAVAVAIDRQPFLQRGLLPLASLTSTVLVTIAFIPLPRRATAPRTASAAAAGRAWCAVSSVGPIVAAGSSHGRADAPNGV